MGTNSCELDGRQYLIGSQDLAGALMHKGMEFCAQHLIDMFCHSEMVLGCQDQGEIRMLWIWRATRTVASSAAESSTFRAISHIDCRNVVAVARFPLGIGFVANCAWHTLLLAC